MPVFTPTPNKIYIQTEAPIPGNAILTCNSHKTVRKSKTCKCRISDGERRHKIQYWISTWADQWECPIETQLWKAPNGPQLKVSSMIYISKLFKYISIYILLKVTHLHTYISELIVIGALYKFWAKIKGKQNMPIFPSRTQIPNHDYLS